MSEETTVEETKPAGPKIVAGFAVLIDEGGNVFIERNPSVFALPVEREASLIEVRRYSSEILMDLQAQAAAEYTSIRIAANKEAKDS